MIEVKVDEKGTLTVPQSVITAIGLHAGDVVSFDAFNGGFLLSKLPVPVNKYDNTLSNAIAVKNLATSITSIRGIGVKLAELLAKRGVTTVEDALYLLPHRYEDRRSVSSIASLTPGSSNIFSGKIVSADLLTTKGGRRYFEAVVADDSGSITLKWFNGNPVFMKRIWTVGRSGLFIGEVSQFNYQREVHHPDVEWFDNGKTVADVLAADTVNFGRIVPVYPLTEGLSQKIMRRVMKNVVETYLPSIQQVIPDSILNHLCLPKLKDSLKLLHLPQIHSDLSELNNGNTPAHKALAFDEFFFWELGLALKRRGVAIEQGIGFHVTHRYTKPLLKLLPFDLTAAQRRVLSEIKEDMMLPHPMHRLVQGDVGSGKTLVALMTALIAVENGYQVAIMAPTEILAEQHWLTIHRWCAQLGLVVVLVTAGLKGSVKKETLQKIADGTAQIVIGTNAVIQQKVDFLKLGLGIIDEQHRFGVLQRGVLKKKGLNPDILVMTATPIPRTLAMTLFGDLSLSVIDELPPGRQPIETRVCFESRRSQVYGKIREEVSRGHQAYIIYPLVEETEKSDMKAATQMAELLGTEIFADLNVGLLHGRMTPEEKETIMATFKSRQLDILVSTTVIEVGIDVPNATLIVVEHAERFGLSQLHQLRGRVGRGSSKSSCILMTSGKMSEDCEKRLRVMESTNDGFRIAEADLEIRGPGDFLGTRQSGMPDFRVANILRDSELLEYARNSAFGLLEKDPELDSDGHSQIKAELLRRWGQRLELATIA